MSWRVDPVTRDYVVSDGLLEGDDGLQTPVLLCLFTERGGWLDDPDFGSRLHDLRRMKVPAAAAVLCPDMVHEALQPLVDDGRIASVTVETEVQRQGLIGHVTVLDGLQRPYVFELFQEVG